jgi:hypothetical protein
MDRWPATFESELNKTIFRNDMFLGSKEWIEMTG